MVAIGILITILIVALPPDLKDTASYRLGHNTLGPYAVKGLGIARGQVSIRDVCSSDAALWIQASNGGGGNKPPWFDYDKALLGCTDYLHEHGWK